MFNSVIALCAAHRIKDALSLRRYTRRSDGFAQFLAQTTSIHIRRVRVGRKAVRFHSHLRCPWSPQLCSHPRDSAGRHLAPVARLGAPPRASGHEVKYAPVVTLAIHLPSPPIG